MYLSSWLPHIITKWGECYLLNNPQIFYTSPSPASLPRWSQLSFIGTTISSLLVHQHSLSRQHVLIMSFLHTTALKMTFSKLKSDPVNTTIQRHCFAVIDRKKHNTLQGIQVSVEGGPYLSLKFHLALFSILLSPLLQFLLPYYPLTHHSVRKAILFTYIMPTLTPWYLNWFLNFKKAYPNFPNHVSSYCIVSPNMMILSSVILLQFQFYIYLCDYLALPLINSTRASIRYFCDPLYLYQFNENLSNRCSIKKYMHATIY